MSASFLSDPLPSRSQGSRYGILYKITGVILSIFGLSMGVPILGGWGALERVAPFLVLGIVGASLGLFLIFIFYTPYSQQIRLREGVFFSCFAWGLTSCLASLPFYCAGLSFSWVDCLLQAVSSLTTTGVPFSLPGLPLSMIWWKLFLQWIGGLGILVMVGLLFPLLNINGVKVLFSELSSKSDKFFPRFSQTLPWILVLYGALGCLCFLSLWGQGMPTLKSLSYAIACTSTGGIVDFKDNLDQLSWGIKGTMTCFMFMGGVPLILLLQVFKNRWKFLRQDPQLQGYCKAYGFSALFIFIGSRALDLGLEGVDVAFATASLLSSTGLSIHGNLQDSPFSSLLLCLGLVGGCAGSTAGGLKIYKIQILWSLLRYHWRQLSYPHGFSSLTYHRKNIQVSAVHGAVVAVFLWFMTFAAVSIIYNATGLSLGASLELSYAVLTNMGGVFINSVDIQSFSSFNKWVTIMGMLLGRLELSSLIVLLGGRHLLGRR